MAENKSDEFPMVIGGAFTPHIGNTIFKLLDKNGLLKSRSVSSCWKDIVDVDTDLWADPDLYTKATNNGNLDLCKKIIECPRTVVKNPTISTGGADSTDSTQTVRLTDRQYGTDSTALPGRTPLGTTQLHIAAFRGYFDICQLILENVEEKNPANKMGKTPLHLAAQGGHLGIVQLIIKNVEQKNPPDEDGNTPLHYAARMYIAHRRPIEIEIYIDIENIDIEIEIVRLILRNVEEKHPINTAGRAPLDEARIMMFGREGADTEELFQKLEQLWQEETRE